ncbi:MAG: SURF1 family cytochrome oxidase biogenesis protein, partial [Dokdonella sp.]
MSAHWRRPRWWAFALTIVGVALFVRAGFWHLDRADEKDRLLTAFAQATTAAPTTLEQARRIASATTFPRVAISGHYDSAHTYLLDDQTRGG